MVTGFAPPEPCKDDNFEKVSSWVIFGFLFIVLLLGVLFL